VLSDPGVRTRGWLGGVRRWLAVALLVAGVALLAWVIGFSGLFGVKYVDVVGVRLLNADEVRTAAAVPLGTPLIRLDAQAIERRISALPEVRRVKVSTSYPAGVELVITERVAVGYRDIGGAAELVDGSDVAFHTIARPPAGLPALDGSVDPARSQAAAAVAAALPDTVARMVVSISAPTVESVTCKLSDERVVLWGGTDRNADKARLLPAVLSQPGSYFDVSDPDAVISRGASGH